LIFIEMGLFRIHSLHRGDKNYSHIFALWFCSLFVAENLCWIKFNFKPIFTHVNCTIVPNQCGKCTKNRNWSFRCELMSALER
jgi:hypothetical protein